MIETAIEFPHLGIYLENVPKNFQVFGYTIAYYGIMLSLGMFFGFVLGAHLAKKSGMDPDIMWDFAVPAIVFSIIGARIYYVAMSWDKYKDDPISVLYIRQGGMAIYGSVIAAFITMYVYTRIKKIPYFFFADQIIPGLSLGQMIGRWGNFFNREAFGGYSDGLLAMKLPIAAVRSNDISAELAAHIEPGMDYIQVHPTFLYESLWNAFVLITLCICHKHKKFDGQIFWMYIVLYGMGRFVIESLRTDQLILPGTSLPVSMVVSSVSAVAALTVLIVNFRKCTNNKGI